MQAERGFVKPFAKLPNMRSEREFLPSCHILPSHLPNCWRGVLSVFAKNQGCQLYLPNFWRCSALDFTLYFHPNTVSSHIGLLIQQVRHSTSTKLKLHAQKKSGSIFCCINLLALDFTCFAF